MTEPRSVTPNPAQSDADASPFATPRTPPRQQPKKRRKKSIWWLFSGILGFGVSVGTVGFLVVNATTQFEVPHVAAPSSPAAPAPTLGATPAPSAAPTVGPSALPSAPASGVLIIRKPATGTTAFPAPVPAPAPDNSVIVRITPTKDDTTQVQTAALSPGDAVNAAVFVKNDGNVDLRYSMVSTTTNPSDTLANAITMIVKVNVTSCNEIGFSQSGTVVYTGPLGSYTGASVIGDPAHGQQPGDRTLSPGQVETLCVNVIMPTNVDNSFQGKSTKVSFTFDSENAN